MADHTAQKYTVTISFPDNTPISAIKDLSVTNTFSSVTSTPSSVVYYLMRWLDTDCVSQPTYRTWVVGTSPDPSGAFYTGTKCGSTLITNAVIAGSWTA